MTTHTASGRKLDSSCCFSWSLWSSVVRVSKTFSNCSDMERLDLYHMSEPSGPPVLITSQVVGRISMKYVCHICCCCTETLRIIKQSESTCQTNQCPSLWRQVPTDAYVHVDCWSSALYMCTIDCWKWYKYKYFCTQCNFYASCIATLLLFLTLHYYLLTLTRRSCLVCLFIITIM